MIRWIMLLVLTLTSCATHPYDPPPDFIGEAVVIISGQRCCGLHHIPLVKSKVYTYDPGVVQEAYVREGYWMVCKAYPNHVKYPYSLNPLPVQMLVGEMEYCPRCEAEIHAAMRAADAYASPRCGKTQPNKSPLPTPAVVTPAAKAPVAPPSGAAGR